MQSLEAGAAFVVSPGLDEDVVATATEQGIPIYPGIYTPTELQRSLNLGLEVVKFFPASIAAGVPALKALSSVFRGIRFMPTGGISEDNLGEYLGVPSVLACSGSWLTPADAVARGDFGEITELAEQALRIAAASRGN
jgi:2-dehydro-3-deoxyphosphogluconate aldolase/(4S)-4-hydroxy-2-oxoglutarate aldolase